MRKTKTLLAVAILGLASGAATAQSIRMDRDGGFSFKFGRDDRRGDVEGKRASCEVYARIAVVQAEANSRFRCGLRGPAWVADNQAPLPVVQIRSAQEDRRRTAQPRGRTAALLR